MGAGEAILVVEDDDVALENLSAFLREAGYVPYCARNGAEAYELIQTQQLSAVLTDVNMPVVDGISLLRQVKDTHPTLPVVIITGRADVPLAVEAMRQGAFDFIAKPFRFQHVELILERALREHSLLEENARLLSDIEQTSAIAWELDRLNRQLREKIEEVSYLHRIQVCLEDTEDSADLCEKLVDLAAELTDSERCSLMLLDHTMQTLTIRAARGMDSEIVPKVKVRVGEGVAGMVAQTGEAMRTGVCGAIARERSPNRYEGSSWISVPLKIKGSVFGVLNVTEKVGQLAFTSADLHRVQALAHKAALRMENSALYESIYYNLVDTLRALVTTIDAKDHYTRNHSQRVTEYAHQIAVEMGLSKQDQDTLGIAAFLHDIGKIGIPDVILLKPRRLTSGEFDVVKSHPVKGEEIVRHIDLLPEEKAIIRNHHERMDGQGYPDGLVGKEIPLLARIVMAADAFDAMTSSRVYRAAKSFEESMRELDMFSGEQFDPEVVQAFKKVLSKNPGCVQQGTPLMQTPQLASGLSSL